MSIDLRTRYLGLDLKNPLVVGASPLGDRIDRVRRIEDAGASALILHSLFEEQILIDHLAEEHYVRGNEESYSEATSYFPSGSDFSLNTETYLTHLRQIKESVSFPVIGSLNGRTTLGWTDYAAEIEGAGADALELNLYFQPTASETGPADIEADALEIVRSVRAAVRIPVAVKLSPYFTSLPHFVRQLEAAGADGVVLFNRFYQPDIDIDELAASPHLELSTSAELLLRLRWLAILHGRFKLDLSCTGGVHTAEDIVKALMSGADSVQAVSAILLNGIEWIPAVLGALETWMEEREYAAVADMKGSMSHENTPNPEAIERANYVRTVTDAQLKERFGVIGL
ncbi:MAG: dihydroorotate dehydrogenase-like protein [Puniceicoccaceae bacterium]